MKKELPISNTDGEMFIRISLAVKSCPGGLSKSGRMGSLRNFFQKCFLPREGKGQGETSCKLEQIRCIALS